MTNENNQTLNANLEDRLFHVEQLLVELRSESRITHREVELILDKLNENQTAQTALDERREKHRLLMASKRRSTSAVVTSQNAVVTSQNAVVTSQNAVVTSQETTTEKQERNEEGGKEKSPLEPPIEKRPEEEKKEKREKATPRARARARGCPRVDEWPQWFEQFWKAYPSYGGRKRDKQKCNNKFDGHLELAAKDDGGYKLFQQMMAGLEAWKASREWKEGFIPAPEVWLNNSRWEVEMAPEDADDKRAQARVGGSTASPLIGTKRAANYLAPTEQDKKSFAVDYVYHLPKGGAQ